MFLGELERFDNEVRRHSSNTLISRYSFCCSNICISLFLKHSQLLLRARIARELTGVDPDLYDRCLKVRKDFDKSF